MKIRFIGDIHGAFKTFVESLNPKLTTIQVGDMGCGFPYLLGRTSAPDKAMTAGKHFFIRGNHDDVEICRLSPHFIEDGTFWEEHKIFFLGGAFSIDRGYRIEGVDWWATEELTYNELQDKIDLYEKLKPDIVVTHDAPWPVCQAILLSENRIPLGNVSRTSQALTAMFERHKPKQWFFGHWHTSFVRTMDGCRFRCLNINEFEDYDLKIMSPVQFGYIDNGKQLLV